MLIVFAATLFQLVCISLFSQSLVYIWSSQVFDEFAENVDTGLKNADFTGTKSIYDYLFSNVSERISGFILRSSEGGHMITFGQSGRGKLIPQVTSAVNDTLILMGHTSATTTDNGGRKLEVEAPKYRLDITIQDPFGMVETQER